MKENFLCCLFPLQFDAQRNRFAFDGKELFFEQVLFELGLVPTVVTLGADERMNLRLQRHKLFFERLINRIESKCKSLKCSNHLLAEGNKQDFRS